MPTITGEEPRLGLQSAPVLAQGSQQDGAEHDVPILMALATLDVDDHTWAIDVANLQASHFGAACSGSVEGHQQNAVEGSGRGVNELGDLRLAQHCGQAQHFLGIRRHRYAPGPPQSLTEKEAQSGQALVDGVRVQLSLAEQIGLILAGVFGTQLVWRAMEVTGKILKRRDVKLDGSRREISNARVLRASFSVNGS